MMTNKEKSKRILQTFGHHIEIPLLKEGLLKEFLSIIRTCYHQWITDQLGTEEEKKEEEVQNIPKEAVLFQTGSYLSQTMLKTSDVDLVFVAPPSIDFQTFSSLWIANLAKVMKSRFGILLKDIEIRSSVFLPCLVRFVCGLFLFDCLFANVNHETWPFLTCPDAFQTKYFLQGTNEPSTIALNSISSVHFMLQQIPNVKHSLWRQFCRFVLLWARRKNLCSNATGFPSSVSYSIMSMKIMQLNPKINNVLLLLHLFFSTFSQWHWSKDAVDVNLNAKPNSLEQQPQPPLDTMTVVLPNHSLQLNTCRNVTPSTLQILLTSLRQAQREIADLMVCKSMHEAQLEKKFQKMYERRGFFRNYSTFIRVEWHKPSSSSLTRTKKESDLSTLCEIRHGMKDILVDAGTSLKKAEIYERPLDASDRVVSFYLGYVKHEPQKDLDFDFWCILNSFKASLLASLQSQIEIKLVDTQDHQIQRLRILEKRREPHLTLRK